MPKTTITAFVDRKAESIIDGEPTGGADYGDYISRNGYVSISVHLDGGLSLGEAPESGSSSELGSAWASVHHGNANVSLFVQPTDSSIATARALAEALLAAARRAEKHLDARAERHSFGK
jgi:hypothetical protein